MVYTSQMKGYKEAIHNLSCSNHSRKSYIIYGFLVRWCIKKNTNKINMPVKIMALSSGFSDCDILTVIHEFKAMQLFEGFLLINNEIKLTVKILDGVY